MNFFATVKSLFGDKAPLKQPNAPLPFEPDPDEIIVPELNVADLRAALEGPQPPLVLDVREQYEWNQVHIADALHIPMNHVPDRLTDLPQDRPIAVLCAHGNRSFGVTHYLREQGFDAYNVIGGITQWHIHIQGQSQTANSISPSSPTASPMRN